MHFSDWSVFAFLSYLRLFGLFYYTEPQPYYALKCLASAEDIKLPHCKGLRQIPRLRAERFSLIAKVMHCGRKAKLGVNMGEVWT